VISDYESSDLRRKLTEINGRQAGDPCAAAQAIVHAVHAENPPLRLALGNAAVDAIRSKLALVAGDLTAWQQVSRAADR
jgi:hypothetical protein